MLLAPIERRTLMQRVLGTEILRQRLLQPPPQRPGYAAAQTD